MIDIEKRRFKLKENITDKEKYVRNLRDELEFCGVIDIEIHENEKEPEKTKTYFDEYGCFFRKQYVDMFYDEIESDSSN